MSNRPRTLILLLGILLLLSMCAWLWTAGSEALSQDPGSVENSSRQFNQAVELDRDDGTRPSDSEEQKARRDLAQKQLAATAKAKTGSLRIELQYSDGSAGAELTVLLAPKGIEVLSPSPDRREELSNESGIILLEDLQPRAYRLAFNHPQHPEQEVRILPGEESLLQVQFKAGLAIRGIVVNRQDRPVPGATIWTSLSQAVRPVATTDADGRFTLRDLRRHLSIGAMASGYAPSPVHALSALPGTELELRLVLQGPGGIVQGTVLDAEGNPTPHATVTFPNRDVPWTFLGDDQSHSLTPRTAFTDKAGRFRCEGLPPLRIAVLAQAAGKGRVEDRVQVIAGGVAEIVLRLPVTAALRGRVLAADGSPIADAWIGASTSRENFQMTESNAEGQYRLSGLLPGEIILKVMAGELSSDFSLQIAAGEDLERDLQFENRALIRGRLVSESGPALEDWMVRASGESRNQASVITDEEGRFTLENLSEGQAYLLEVFGKNDRWHSAFVFEDTFPSSEEIELRVPLAAQATGSIQGRILNWLGEPMAAAQVGAAQASQLMWIPETLGPDGRFHFTDLPVGEYLLAIKAGPQWQYMEPIMLQADELMDLGDLHQPQSGSCTLILKEAPELSSTRILILDHKRRLIAVVKPEGPGLLQYPMPAGSFFIQIDGEGFSSRETPLEIRGGEDSRIQVDAAASRTAQLTFAAKDSSVHALGKLQLSIFDASGSLFLQQQIAATGGRYLSTRKYLLGPYRFEARGPKGLAADGEFAVTAGEGELAGLAFELR